MYEIKRYTVADKSAWDGYVAQSKNGTFLFYRDYMDYHSDRFHDHSLMFYRGGKLYALLAANIEGDVLWSHRGLTYGGLVTNSKTTAACVQQLFRELGDYLRGVGVRRVIYKPVPHIYHHLPAEEDLYALCNVCHARVLSRDIASVLMLNHQLPISTLRRRGIKKAFKAQLSFRETNDWTAFWTLLEERLLHRHGAHPVHSLAEIQQLHSCFPDDIRLFAAYHDGCMLGGTVLYVNGQTVKTQYIAANDKGLAVGALDGLFDYLLTHLSADSYTFFDFGTSNMPDSDDLHDSLIFQKEGFGARGICYDTYEWEL